METLRMSVNERRRLEVLSRVKSREVSQVKAAEVLAISYRQAKRLWARFTRARQSVDVAGSDGIAQRRSCGLAANLELDQLGSFKTSPSSS
jgi:hypothetical protein